MAREVKPRATGAKKATAARAKGRASTARTGATRKAPARKAATRATPVARKAPARKAATPRTRRPAAPVPSREEDALAVEAANRRYYDAFQKLSMDEVAKVWWHDDQAGCIHPGWDARHGWMEVLSSYAEIFTSTQSIRFALGDVRVRVSGDLAYVFCIENLVSEETDSPDFMGAVLATNLFERRRGEWRLIHHHASPFAPDAAGLPEGPLH